MSDTEADNLLRGKKKRKKSKSREKSKSSKKSKSKRSQSATRKEKLPKVTLRILLTSNTSGKVEQKIGN